MSDFTIQNIINRWVDTHVDAIIDRLSLHMRDAATIEQESYNPLKHRGLLMLYIYDGVQKIVDVAPESLLDSILQHEQEYIDRISEACQDSEALVSRLTSLEDTWTEDERLRNAAEEARAAAELLRAAAELTRSQAENLRQSQEQTRQSQETARQQAETTRSSWYDVFRATVESWFSSPSDGTGIQERWNTFKTSADAWVSSSRSAFTTFFGADENSGIRGLWKSFYPAAQTEYQALKSEINSDQQEWQGAEDLRQSQETSRQSAETLRGSAESLRQSQEQTRQTQESSRQSNEGSRQHEETLRSVAESDREDSEDSRVAAELIRQADYSALMANMQALFQQMTVRANHPTLYGEDGYLYEYDLTTSQYVKTNHFWQKLERFRVSKDFASIALMNAYDPANLPQGEDPLELFDFVIIKSTVDDPDNSKLYSYMGENVDNDPAFERWHYLGDFSGARGFAGKTPQFSIGNVVSGSPGTMPTVTLSFDGYDGNENPKFLLNFSIPRGDTGLGISSVQQVQRSAVSEGENVWRMTLTNGQTTDFVVLNGQRGLKGDPFLYSDLTANQKAEMAGLASGFRFNFNENTGNLDITPFGSATAEIVNDTLCLSMNLPQSEEEEEENNPEPQNNE